MGGKVEQLNMISVRGLKLSDRVWYNAIYYIAYSHNPKEANYQCKLGLHRKYGRPKAFHELLVNATRTIGTLHGEKYKCPLGHNLILANRILV